MRYLSVCSGIEAASVAWESLGWTPVAFAEIERFPSQVLAHHFPHVPNLGDMTRYKDWDIDRDTVDLIVGGTPCQVKVVKAFNHQSGGDMRGIDPRPTAQLQRHQETSILHGMAVRRLTPIECERLQGFPDGWTDILPNTPDGSRYKAIGNSMAVPVMRWIGSRIQACR